MLKSTIKKREYQAIYRLLDRVSPVPFDCGHLCGCVCCVTESGHGAGEDEAAPEMGIYLLPGEDKVHSRRDDWLIWICCMASVSRALRAVCPKAS